MEYHGARSNMTGTLRVLHVSPFVVPDPILGGMPQSVLALGVALRRRGHDVTIWASDAGDPRFWARSREEDGFLTIRLFKTRWRRLGSILNTPILPDLAIPDPRILRDFDIVHLHGYWNTFTPGVALGCRKTSTPLILQPRGSLVQSGQREFAKRFFQLLFRDQIVRSTATAIALTESERGQLLKNGFQEARIRVVPNMAPSLPSNLPTAASAREALRIPDGAKAILFLGRLHPAKGVKELLMAYRFVRQEAPDSVLLIGGADEGMLAELKKIARESDMESVQFLGPLDEERKWLALRAANLFCLPSSFEAFPRVVLEAGVIGIPTILSTHVDLPYANADGAVLKCDRDPRALSRCILSVLLNEVLQLELSERIRAWVQRRFSPDVVVELVEGVYSHAIHGTVS